MWKLSLNIDEFEMCETPNFGTQAKYFSQMFETLLESLQK
jgi:hypothetical protein